MRENSFRKRVATGSFTLPVAAALALFVWLPTVVATSLSWLSLVVVVVITYLLVELNNRNALLRIRSRMVGTTFLALAAACPFFHSGEVSLLPSFTLAAAYFPLFATYQSPRSSGEAFQAALLIGVGSLVYPPLLCLNVFVLVALAVPLRALSGRTFMGVLFGSLLPYYFVAAIGAMEGCLNEIFIPYLDAFKFTLPDYRCLHITEIVSCCFTLLLALIGIVHFLRTAFNDKIRTRMFFDVLIVLEFVLILAVVLQPRRADVLMPLLIVNSSPIIAHHYALGRGRWLDIRFILVLLLLMGIIGCNLFFHNGSFR